MTVSNSCGTRILKFDDAIGVLPNKKAHRKSSALAETSVIALSVDQRGRPMNRDKKKNGKSKSKSRRGFPRQGVPNVDGMVKKGIFILQAEEGWRR